MRRQIFELRPITGTTKVSLKILRGPWCIPFIIDFDNITFSGLVIWVDPCPILLNIYHFQKGNPIRPLLTFLVVSLHVPFCQRVRIISNRFVINNVNYVNVKCSWLVILRIISVTNTFTVRETCAKNVNLTNLKVTLFPITLYSTVYSALFTLPISTSFVV